MLLSISSQWAVMTHIIIPEPNFLMPLLTTYLFLTASSINFHHAVKIFADYSYPSLPCSHSSAFPYMIVFLTDFFPLAFRWCYILFHVSSSTLVVLITTYVLEKKNEYSIHTANLSKGFTLQIRTTFLRNIKEHDLLECSLIKCYD